MFARTIELSHIHAWLYRLALPRLQVFPFPESYTCSPEALASSTIFGCQMCQHGPFFLLPTWAQSPEEEESKESLNGTRNTRIVEEYENMYRT